jgi:tRNA(fMet)-specific endonuclease VapC
LLSLVIADFDEQVAASYGNIRAELQTQGILIESLDLLIAAPALSLGVTLVTSNIKESSRVPHPRLPN